MPDRSICTKNAGSRLALANNLVDFWRRSTIYLFDFVTFATILTNRPVRVEFIRLSPRWRFFSNFKENWSFFEDFMVFDVSKVRSPSMQPYWSSSVRLYSAPQYGHFASPVSSIGRNTFGCEFQRYIPGIGHESGKSRRRAVYLCCAFAAIKFWSTVPALAITGSSHSAIR